MITNRLALGMVGRFAKSCYRRAAAVRVVSPGFRENLIRKGVPREKIYLISNWVDAEFYQPAAPNPETARRLGLAGRFNVMFAGSIGLPQGLDVMLDAAELLRDLPDVQFVLVGDGPDLDRVRAEAVSRRLANVRLLGRFPGDEMPGLYAVADVLLVHLRDEPLFRITIPHKIFAYMASARPVLAALAGDGAEVIRSANAGLICPPSQPQALADTIRQFHHMSAKSREALGRNGRLAACEHYNREHLIGRIEEMLTEVVERHRGKL